VHLARSLRTLRDRFPLLMLFVLARGTDEPHCVQGLRNRCGYRRAQLLVHLKRFSANRYQRGTGWRATVEILR